MTEKWLWLRLCLWPFHTYFIRGCSSSIDLQRKIRQFFKFKLSEFRSNVLRRSSHWNVSRRSVQFCHLLRCIRSNFEIHNSHKQCERKVEFIQMCTIRADTNRRSRPLRKVAMTRFIRFFFIFLFSLPWTLMSKNFSPNFDANAKTEFYNRKLFGWYYYLLLVGMHIDS